MEADVNQPFRAHVLVCTQEKPDRTPCCAAVGGRRILEEVQAEVARAGLTDAVLITACGCLGTCDRGPNVVVYPEGRWYTAVAPGDVPGIVREHLAAGHPVARAADPDAATLQAEANAHRSNVRKMLAARAAAGALPEETEALLRGFQPSRAALTAIELDVFTAVHAGGESGASAAEVAERTATSLRGMAVLLDALCALGLLVKQAGRYRNGATAESHLRAGSPHDARTALLHTAHLWQRWSTLTECVRRGTTLVDTDMKERGEEWTEPFIAAMQRNAFFRAPVVVGALDLGQVRRALDVGGGSGAYAAALARATPDLEVTVLDLPNVTPLTRRYLAAAGAGERVRTVDGDFRTDPLGSGFDLVLLSAICHMNGPAENVALFRKAHAALTSGGQIVVHDFVLDDDRAGPRSGALFALNMLVGTPHGSSYSGAEYAAWLAEAGFDSPRRVPLPGPTDLMVAGRG
jgi:(2Fe-2S) ferredoxin/predicted O-methyltransferase YrrM